jgi:hypothetical protein
MASSIVYNGKTYYFNGKDYYRNSNGQLLQREVWKDHYGPIPPGYVIHHKDENKLNNDIGNLEIMPRGDHVRLHGLRGWAAWSKEQRSEDTKRQWAKRKSSTRKCRYCGGEYQTTSTYSSWCSPKCQVAARYHGKTGPCTRDKRPGL